MKFDREQLQGRIVEERETRNMTTRQLEDRYGDEWPSKSGQATRDADEAVDQLLAEGHDLEVYRARLNTIRDLAQNVEDSEELDTLRSFMREIVLEAERALAHE